MRRRMVFMMIVGLISMTMIAAPQVGAADALSGASMEVPADEASPGTDVMAILQSPVEDMPVLLRGNIIKRAYHEHYVFSDGSGEIVLDIDDDYFPRRGMLFNPGMAVVVTGLVDRRFLSHPEIEVRKIVMQGGN